MQRSKWEEAHFFITFAWFGPIRHRQHEYFCALLKSSMSRIKLRAREDHLIYKEQEWSKY